MLTLDEAVVCAAVELAHDSDLLGTKIVAGPGTETPNFWLFYPNSPRAFGSSRPADSLSFRIPPLIVDRRTGGVSRPFGPGSRVRAVDLGVSEWFILPPTAPSEHDPLDGFGLSSRELERVRGLRFFRASERSRDGGSSLDTFFVAVNPQRIEPGLRSAGLEPIGSGWSFGANDRVHGHVDMETATVFLSIAGNGVDASPWSFAIRDIELAERIETSLSNVDWIRFWG